MKDLIERLPKNIMFQLDQYIADYKNATIPREHTRAAVGGYAKGLRDAGMITDHERGMLCVYCSTRGRRSS